MPIVSLHATSNIAKRSLAVIFQFRVTTFKSHPSGISPSKNENNVLEVKLSVLIGKVSDTGTASSLFA